MRKILYAGTELLTGDAIADALMELSRALAETHAAQSVEIPVIGPDGERAMAYLLVGPASQIVTLAMSTDLPEVIDDAVVAGLGERTRRLTPVITASDDPGEDLRWTDDL